MFDKVETITIDCGIRWSTCCSINNIFTYAKYHQVKVAGDEAVLWSSTTSLGKIIKKSNVLFVQEEKKNANISNH
jgi:CRISPR/Cas system CMR-associated protein Cmr1 (group 7 of RAMP superfamily)